MRSKLYERENLHLPTFSIRICLLYVVYIDRKQDTMQTEGCCIVNVQQLVYVCITHTHSLTNTLFLAYMYMREYPSQISCFDVLVCIVGPCWLQPKTVCVYQWQFQQQLVFVMSDVVMTVCGGSYKTNDATASSKYITLPYHHHHYHPYQYLHNFSHIFLLTNPRVTQAWFHCK